MLLFSLLRRALASTEFRILGTVCVLVLGVGTLFFHVQEGLRWLDAAYLAVITLTTVGYGDISPKTDLGKLFTMAYVLIGLGLVAAFIGMVTELVLAEARERRQKREGAPGP